MADYGLFSGFPIGVLHFALGQRRAPIMKKNINVQTTNATQSTTAKQNYQPTGYYLIEDEDMRKYLESTGTKIVTIALNGKKHMYALIPCETQVEADNLNRSLNTMKKKVDRSRAKHKLYEVSLDTMTTARSEEQTSELQSHSEISYAVLCLKNKNIHTYTDLCTT